MESVVGPLNWNKILFWIRLTVLYFISKYPYVRSNALYWGFLSGTICWSSGQYRQIFVKLQMLLFMYRTIVLLWCCFANIHSEIPAKEIVQMIPFHRINIILFQFGGPTTDSIPWVGGRFGPPFFIIAKLWYCTIS